MLEESTYYHYQYRVISTDLKEIKHYADKLQVSVTEEVSFDIDRHQATSLDHFHIAISSSILKAITAYDQAHLRDIQKIEGVFQFQLTDPLAYLGVVGMQGNPKIDRVSAKIFLECDGLIEDAEAYAMEALGGSVVYQSVNQALDFDFVFEAIL